MKIKTVPLHTEDLLIKSNMHSGGHAAVAAGGGAGAGRKVNPNATHELQVKMCQGIFIYCNQCTTVERVLVV